MSRCPFIFSLVEVTHLWTGGLRCKKRKPAFLNRGCGWTMFQETNPEYNQKLIDTNARARESLSRDVNQLLME